jgi:hypothetical protein
LQIETEIDLYATKRSCNYIKRKEDIYVHTPYSHPDCQYQEWRVSTCKKGIHGLDCLLPLQTQARKSISFILELQTVQRWIQKNCESTLFIMVELMSCCFHAE